MIPFHLKEEKAQRLDPGLMKKKCDDHGQGPCPRSVKEDMIKGSCGRERLKKMAPQAVLIYHHCANSFHTTTLQLPKTRFFRTNKIIRGERRFQG